MSRLPGVGSTRSSWSTAAAQKPAGVAIARTHGATVHTNPWPGFAAQRIFALAQATADWVISLDADEELEPRLVHEIRTASPAARRTSTGS